MLNKDFIYTGKTLDQAMEAACLDLGIDRDDFSVEVLETPQKGFLGLKSTLAKIKITIVNEVLKKEFDKRAADAKAKAEEAKSAVTKQEKPEKLQKPAKTEKEEKKAELKSAKTPKSADKNSINHTPVTFVEELLKILEFGATVTETNDDKGVCLNIQGEKMGLLIGRRGETIDALQYITNLAVNKGDGDRQKILIDTENYRNKREETLTELAKKVAAKVIKYRKSTTLEAMPPNERRIIHAALNGYPGIVTFSTGSEPNRKVIVTPDRGQKKPSFKENK